MKLSWLKCVEAVAEEGSFTKAAKRLGLTQPTVSALVSTLEESIGAPLFLRTTRRVQLTELGQRLLPAVKRVLAAEQDLQAEIVDIKNPQRPLLRVGVSPVVDIGLVLAVLEPYQLQHPEVDLVLKDCFLDDLEERLANGKIDLAVGVGFKTRPGRSGIDFYRDPLRYLPPHHASVPHPNVSTDEILKSPILMPVNACGLAGEIERLLSGLAPVIYGGRAMAYGVLMEWSELGIGGALLPQRKCPPGFPGVVDSSGQNVVLQQRIVWERSQQYLPHVGDIVQHLRRCAPAIVTGLTG